VLTLLRHPAVSSDEDNVDPSTMRVDALSKVLGRDQGTRPNGPFLDLFERAMLFRDPPDHTRLRSLVSKAFTPRRAEQVSERVQRIVDEMLDRVESRRHVELLTELAYPLPARVICELLGVPAADSDFIVRCARPLATGLDPSPMRSPTTLTEADQATRAFVEYLERLITDRRRQPGDDLLSALIAAETDGDRLAHDELVSTLVLLLIAGHETTANLIGNGVLALLRNPAELARLRADPGLDATAVDELLRYDSPVQMTQRITLDDVTLGDVTIGPGRIVIAILAAANHDPAVFDEPERLDVGRTPNPHLAFGSGPHYCIGAALARLEARIAIGTLVRRFPGLRLARAPRWRSSFTIRGLRELHLDW
jgi:cytochrome P450